jgi:hypothetical protein
MTDQLDPFLAAYSRESRENTLCLRNLVFEVFPNMNETIDNKTGMITYSLSKERNIWVFAISLHMKHINLIFSKGAKLPDPTKLLTGTGKETRHIKIKSEGEIQNPAVRQLLQEVSKLV